MYKNLFRWLNFLTFPTILIIGIYRFWPVLSNYNVSLVNAGDGIGSLSWVVVMGEQFRGSLFDYLFSDFISNPHVGMGLMSPAPGWGIVWRILILPALLFNFEPEQVYDFMGFEIFILTLLSCIGLTKLLKAPVYLGLFMGLSLALMDNSVARLSGHITLAASFGLVIQIYTIIFAAKKQTVKSYILMGVGSWLSFSVNEYYGVYGLLSAPIVFFGSSYLYYDRQQTFKHFFKRLLIGIVVACFLFLLLMIISYPTMMGAKIGLGGQNQSQIMTLVSHSSAELNTYGVKNLSQIWQYYTASNVQYGNPAEFTFRLGLAVFLVAALMLFLSLLKIQKHPKYLYSEELDYKFISLFAITIVIILPLAVAPSAGFSLASLVHKFLPMIRVPARALILVDIFALLIYVKAIHSFQKIYLTKDITIISKCAYLLFIGASLAWTFIDITSGRPFQVEAKKLPQGYEIVTKQVVDMDGGQLLELPFYGPADTPEKSYEYLYNWTHHKIPILNAPFHNLSLVDSKASENIERLADELNININNDILEALGLNGVEYIVSNCGDSSKNFLLTQTDKVILISVNGCQHLFKINSYRNGNPLDLVKYYDQAFFKEKELISPADCKNMNAIALNFDGKKIYKPNENLLIDVELMNMGVKERMRNKDLRLGVIWFKMGSDGVAIGAGFGEGWTKIPAGKISQKGARFFVKAQAPSNPGTYQMYLSPMQPGNLWCFHVGAEPFKITMRVAE